jgi:hypothetical protein
MTGSQFSTLLNAIEDVRKDLSAKLDSIEERLRIVEVDQAKASAIVENNNDRTIGVQWKIGITVSAVGVVATLIVSLLP